MAVGKPSLIGMSTHELEELLESLGEPAFRGRQIAHWIYKSNAPSLSEMTNLPLVLRQRLGDLVSYHRARIVSESRSVDGTVKYLLEMADGEAVESVLLPYIERVSVCVSTQIGCAVGCIFCASGKGGFVRDLTAGEIVDQVLTLQKQSSRRISHVVYMGMGEPLLNYENVLKSIKLLNQEVGIAMRHITVSTVGITPNIERLAEEDLQLTLAVSLHAATDELRQQIIPIARRYPLRELVKVCKSYAEKTGRRITFEYLLIRGLNDAVSHAMQLARLLRGILCNVNLIPYNAIEGIPLDRPSQKALRAFRSVLESEGLAVTQRIERGHAVSAACGQLRRRIVAT